MHDPAPVELAQRLFEASAATKTVGKPYASLCLSIGSLINVPEDQPSRPITRNQYDKPAPTPAATSGNFHRGKGPTSKASSTSFVVNVATTISPLPASTPMCNLRGFVARTLRSPLIFGYEPNWTRPTMLRRFGFVASCTGQCLASTSCHASYCVATSAFSFHLDQVNTLNPLTQNEGRPEARTKN